MGKVKALTKTILTEIMTKVIMVKVKRRTDKNY